MTFVLSIVVAESMVVLTVLMIVMEEDKKTLDKMVTMSADSRTMDRHYLSQLHSLMMNESHETKVDRNLLMKTMKDD